MAKKYVSEKMLIQDSFKLGMQVYESGFRPDFLVGLWRGGSSVGIYVQECLQYLGVETTTSPFEPLIRDNQTTKI